MNRRHSLRPPSSFHIRGDCAFLPRYQWARHNCQAGTALVMALVILMILTILGISSMNTSIMEERMSGNIQDLNRAFEASESGLTRAYRGTIFNPANPPATIDYDFGTGTTATKASVTTTFIGMSLPQVNSGMSKINSDSANFSQVSTGTTSILETGAEVELHQGVSQVVPK